MQRGSRSKKYRKTELGNDKQSILKFLNPEQVTMAKSSNPDLDEEDLVDKILQLFKPQYKTYEYTMSIQEEIKEETPAATKIMFEYLTKQCQNCVGANCIDFHDPKMKRRPPARLFMGLWNYEPTMCKMRTCDVNCQFAHNDFEVFYHPMNYKTQVCEFPLIEGKCKLRGNFCFKSHGDLRKPSLAKQSVVAVKSRDDGKYENIPFSVDTFKTLPCKLNVPHEKSSCNFYHMDLTDRRRDPKKFNYGCNECPKGFNQEFLCKYRDLCKYAHNEYEKKYHKDNYLVTPCNNKSCKLQEKCPFSHKESEKVSKESIAEELLNYKKSYSLLMLELESLRSSESTFSHYKCSYCEDFLSEYILRCGHLVCQPCSELSVCQVCLRESRPMIELKLS